MTLLPVARPVSTPVRGCQTPRVLWSPPHVSSSGAEAVEFCRSVGLVLDPWQELVLEHGLAEDPADRRRWAAFEAAMVVNRQNGKGEILMAREVVGLFLFDEQLMLHSAHRFKTCRESFKRIVSLVTNNDHLRRRVKAVRYGAGEEAIELLNGGRLLFLARMSASGRGLTGDTIIFDEAQILSDEPISAMLPTLSTRPNPQIWYAGTTGNPESVQLASLRRRALAGGEPHLAYLEWSVDPDGYDPASPADWAVANPALGLRISVDYVEKERAAMSPVGFAAERLGVGEWPSDVTATWEVISEAVWNGCADPHGAAPDRPVCFAVDVNPERSSAAICVAGRREDGRLVVEVADQRAGLGWVPGRVAELVAVYEPLATVVDRAGPAGTLIAQLETAGLEVNVPAAADVARAAEGLFDSASDGSLVHAGDLRLAGAVAGAKQRPIGDAWGWARRTSNTDISPLVAASLALWGFLNQSEEVGTQAW